MCFKAFHRRVKELIILRNLEPLSARIQRLSVMYKSYNPVFATYALFMISDCVAQSTMVLQLKQFIFTASNCQLLSPTSFTSLSFTSSVINIERDAGVRYSTVFVESPASFFVPSTAVALLSLRCQAVAHPKSNSSKRTAFTPITSKSTI